MKRKRKPICIACNDTGVNSKGGLCQPCLSHGRITHIEHQEHFTVIPKKLIPALNAELTNLKVKPKKRKHKKGKSCPSPSTSNTSVSRKRKSTKRK